MDILISSNLERLIYKIADEDAQANASMMQALSKEGKYTITESMKEGLCDFVGGYASEKETAERIKEVYENSDYVMDTHTAVASHVYKQYQAQTADETVTVIASTASPYKFTRSVMDAILPEKSFAEDFALVDELSALSKVSIPDAIAEIRTAEILHKTVCEVSDMCKEVKRFLGIE